MTVKLVIVASLQDPNDTGSQSGVATSPPAPGIPLAENSPQQQESGNSPLADFFSKVADPSVWAALTIAYFALRQVHISRRQASILRRQTRTYRHQLRSTLAIERAYVAIAHFVPIAPQSTINWTADGGPRIVFVIVNTGNTPCRVTDVAVLHWFTYKQTDLPDKLPTLASMKAGSYLTKTASFTHTQSFPLSPEQIAAVRSGALGLVIMMHVDYIDVFGRRYRAGYARQYFLPMDQPGMDCFSVVTKPGYNYDRLRKPGEGNDWDGQDQHSKSERQP